MKNCDASKSDPKQALCRERNIVNKDKVQAVLKLPTRPDAPREIESISDSQLERIRILTGASLGLTSGAYNVCLEEVDEKGIYTQAVDADFDLLFMALVDGEGHEDIQFKVNFAPWAGFAQQIALRLRRQLSHSKEAKLAASNEPGILTIFEKYILPKAAYAKANKDQQGLVASLDKAVDLFKAESIIRVRDVRMGL